MKWSRLRAHAKAMLAESVRKRVDFHTTSYGSRPGDWDSRAWVTVDGREVLNLAALYGCTCALCSVESDDDSVFGESRLIDGLAEWIGLTAKQALNHDDALIRALAILDRRVGKRQLLRFDLQHGPPLSRLFLLLRCEGERLQVPEYLAGNRETLERTLRKRDLVSKKRRGPDPAADRRKKRLEADAKLALTGKDNIRRLIQRAASGEQVAARSESGRILVEAFQRLAADTDDLNRLLCHVEQATDLLQDPRYAKGVAALAEGSESWIRQPEDWVPKGRNASRQFAALARWLWAEYEVPLLFDQAWFEAEETQRAWFRHLGAGGNLRTAPGLPCPLTKKMAHHVLRSPQSLTIWQAIRWGQTVALGGDERLATAVATTRIGREFADDPFWLSVMRFFVRNPMLDRVHVGPIVDYVWSQRFEPVRVDDGDGGLVIEPPPQPNFTMNGRRVESLLRDVEAWHREINRVGTHTPARWAPSGVESFAWRDKKSTPPLEWVFRELLSTDALIEEGRRMRHCVSAYAGSCARGAVSIWSLECQVDGLAPEPKLTIEVQLPKRWIGEVRGPMNRMPTAQENRVIDRWVRAAGLWVFRARGEENESY